MKQSNCNTFDAFVEDAFKILVDLILVNRLDYLNLITRNAIMYFDSIVRQLTASLTKDDTLVDFDHFIEQAIVISNVDFENVLSSLISNSKHILEAFGQNQRTSFT